MTSRYLSVIAGVVCAAAGVLFFVTGAGILEVAGKIVVYTAGAALLCLGGMLAGLRVNRVGFVNLLVALVAIVVCLILAEVSLRALWGKDRVSIHRSNPNGTGSYRLKPNLDITRQVKTEEFLIRTNSHGMRWREVPYVVFPGKKRVAFTGDSFTFGCWADSVEESFVGVFESLLDSGEFEALNFGVTGYGLLDIRLQVKEEILLFRPDYLVLVFFNGNDFRDTYMKAERYGLDVGAESPVGTSGNKKPAKPLLGTLRQLARRLYVYRLFVMAVDAGMRKAYVVGERTRSFPENDAFRSYTFWCKKEYTPEAAVARDLSLDVIGDIRDICESNGIRMMIAAVPFREQVYAAVPSGKNYDIRFPQKYLEEYAEVNGIPYLDLLPVLRAAGSTEELYYYRDMHFNNRGHYVAGEAIAEFFKEKMDGEKEQGL